MHLEVTWGSTELVCIHLGKLFQPSLILLGSVGQLALALLTTMVWNKLGISRGFTSTHIPLVQVRLMTELKA